MTDFVEYIPKRHGQKPDYWTPDTLTGLDNKNYVRQPNWAWIAGTTYYVPYEAVHGVPRLAPVDDGADLTETTQANTIEELRAANEKWVIAFNQAEAYANGRIEALQARVEFLEDGLRTIQNYTGEHYGAANTLRLIRMLLGEGDEGASQ